MTTKDEINADLLDAANRLCSEGRLDCLYDPINPCTLSGLREHWGAGKACPACHLRAAIDKAVGEDR